MNLFILSVLKEVKHKHGTFYDSTQLYRIKPGSIMRMEKYSWWYAKHAVPDGSIDKGQRIILILRPIHPTCNKLQHNNKK